MNQVETVIRSTERRLNSANGNPRYKVVTDHGAFLTRLDADVTFRITNSEYSGTPVTLTLEKGEIKDVEVREIV